jgi:hypothetical protein
MSKDLIFIERYLKNNKLSTEQLIVYDILDFTNNLRYQKHKIYSLIDINITANDNVYFVLDKIIPKLINGGLIRFYNWFDECHLFKSVYDSWTLYKNQHSELQWLEFPTIEYNQRIFIVRKVI